MTAAPRQTDFFDRYIDKIEVARVKLGISIEALCREACISARTYHYLLAAGKLPRRETASKLENAIETIKGKQAQRDLQEL